MGEGTPSIIMMRSTFKADSGLKHLLYVFKDLLQR